MKNTICVTPNVTNSNEILSTVPQSKDHSRCEWCKGYSRSLASCVLSGVLAFGAGATLSATSEVIEQPVEVTAALLKEVI